MYSRASKMTFSYASNCCKAVAGMYGDKWKCMKCGKFCERKGYYLGDINEITK